MYTSPPLYDALVALSSASCGSINHAQLQEMREAAAFAEAAMSAEPHAPAETSAASAANKPAEIFIEPPGSTAKTYPVGVMLYGAGLVDPRSYSVLAAKIAQCGFPVAILCFAGDLPRDPKGGRAAGVASRLSQVERWVLAGHSMGGHAAASAAAALELDLPSNVPAFPYKKLAGIAVLGGRVSGADMETGLDLSAAELPAVAIAGGRDSIVRPEEVEAGLRHMPDGTGYIVIASGTHQGFAHYDRGGRQEGIRQAFGDAAAQRWGRSDGVVTGPERESQVALAAGAIASVCAIASASPPPQ